MSVLGTASLNDRTTPPVTAAHPFPGVPLLQAVLFGVTKWNQHHE